MRGRVPVKSASRRRSRVRDEVQLRRVARKVTRRVLLGEPNPVLGIGEAEAARYAIAMGIEAFFRWLAAPPGKG